MKRHLGAILFVMLVVAVGSVVAWKVYFTPTEGGPNTGPGESLRIAVEVVPVSAGTLRDIRVLSGTLEAFTRFDVAAKIGGLVEHLAVDLGDDIQRGQVIATIDDAEYVQTVAQMEAELAVRKAEVVQVEAELVRVQSDYERLQALSSRGVVSDVEMNDITASLASQKAALALAEARVRHADAALELARIRLGYTTVSAIWENGPDTVTVGERYEDSGDTVQAGDPLVGVVALDPLRAVVSITERDYSRLSVGQTATLTTDALPDQVFAATITRIAPVFRESSRQARIELEVANADHVLRPGLFARVTIVLREEHEPTIVPLSAITKRDEQNVVFVLNDDGETVRMEPIRIDIIDGERVGIAAGELNGPVVVLGQQMLTDGSAVRVHTPTTAPADEDPGV